MVTHSARAGLVEIVRDFLLTYQSMRSLLVRYRTGALRFEAVQALFADTEESPIYRLKERCHALFRPGTASVREARPREVLFDLAVGSLFHEAMKFRESFYQSEVYGPRVRALRAQADAESAAMFREFEKILAAVTDRLEEGLQETVALLERTREQLTVLLCEHPEDGHVVRHLLEQRAEVEAVFPEGLDALLTQVYGSPAAARGLAGRSYLTSGYYGEATRALESAMASGGDGAALAPLAAYARGMAAYLDGEYGESVTHLETWLGAPGPRDPAQAALVVSALSRVDRLAQGPDRERVARAAASVVERLGGASPGAEDQPVG